ncbi:MAG TPA: hypothetical protein VLW85_09685 [Myxococcales bacterium]|nr:hypothetical protein [Myxococcales bacterium]
MTRRLAIGALLLGCAHARTPEQKAMMARGDCAELLEAADAARAGEDNRLAADLAAACTKDKLASLMDGSAPAQALLWCGRARAARQPGCDHRQVIELTQKLLPHVTIGPPDETIRPDPMLAAALQQLGKDLNIAWDGEDPDVIVGKLTVTLDHLTSATVASVVDAKGGKQRVPATQHRFVARAQAQVELGEKTRMLHASEEARDSTWEASARLAVPAKFAPVVPATDDLKQRAVLAWLRALGKALAAEPPEDISADDDKGCVAYGLALNIASGNSLAAARGLGEPEKVASCEKLLGEPPGAGIPVP